MVKWLKNTVLLLVLPVLTSAVLFACSSGGGGVNTKGRTLNEAYIISEKDFAEFQEKMLSPEQKAKYTVPAVTEITVGEKYYAVAYTVAETLDGSNIEFGKGTLLLRETSANMSADEAIEIEDYGEISVGTLEVGVFEGKDDVGNPEYEIVPDAHSSKAEFIVYAKFTAIEGGELEVRYSINATKKKNEFGHSAEKQTAKALLYYPKKVSLSDLNVSYLESESYVGGRYEESALLKEISMSVGKEYYMVVSAKMTTLFDTDGTENASFELRLSPSDKLNGTLETADSGTFEENVIGAEKKIKVTFKIPEKSDVGKKFEFIVKLSPVSAGEGRVSVDFTAKGISFLGTKTLNKSLALFGETVLSDGFEYTLSTDGTYYKLSGKGTASGSMFKIPAEHNGLPVKEISAYAFDGLDTVRVIYVPEGIEKIGAHAFRDCTALETLALPGTATLVEGILSGCSSLKWLEVNLDNIKLKKLFEGSSSGIPVSLETVSLVGTVSLCENAFEDCEKIKSISLPATLTTVGKNAFDDCSSLATFKLDEKNKSMFMQCGILYMNETNKILGSAAYFSGEMTYPNGITAIPGGDMSAVTHITVPDTVTRFKGTVTGLSPSEAKGPSFLFKNMSDKKKLVTAVVTSGSEAPLFYGATKLTSVTLPGGITQIANNSFHFCSSLKSIEIPSGVVSIGDVAFSGCSSLASISIPATVTKIGEWAFEDCVSLSSVTSLGGITEIAMGTFSGCKALKTINLPSGVTKIGKQAFEDCISLTSVNVPYGVEIIKEKTFFGCTRLKSVLLPDSVTEIKEEAFAKSGLEAFELPSSVAVISTAAFNNCQSLKSIAVRAGNTSFHSIDGVLYHTKTNQMWIRPAGKQ